MTPAGGYGVGRGTIGCVKPVGQRNFKKKKNREAPSRGGGKSLSSVYLYALQEKNISQHAPFNVFWIPFLKFWFLQSYCLLRSSAVAIGLACTHTLSFLARQLGASECESFDFGICRSDDLFYVRAF